MSRRIVALTALIVLLLAIPLAGPASNSALADHALHTTQYAIRNTYQVSPPAAQEDVNRAALVVRNADGHVDKECVTFTEPTISGEELLWNSGLDVVISQEGAVCAIGGYGCPADDCFCHCTGQPCEYWAYYHWQNNAWHYSDVGAGWFQVTDGALEGWSWGPGNFSSGTEPPLVAFSDVCAVAATPTATPTPSATPTVSQIPPTIPAEAPGATFEVMNNPVSAGTCTILKWLVWGAERITLDGETVLPQDRREVCPTATKRYVLVAANAAGQVSREVTVEVLGAASPAPQTSPTAQATATLPASAQTATPAPARPTAPAGNPSRPAPATATAVPAAPVQVVSATPGAPAAAPTAPAAAPPTSRMPAPPSPTATPTATRPARTAAPGRPTSPPILLARAPEAGQAAGSADGGANAQGKPAGEKTSGAATTDRSFHPAYLPQYAAFALIAAVLLGAAVWVARKRNQ